jgi:hypothetical protein
LNLVSPPAPMSISIPRTEACQCVDSINVHGTTPANSLTATPPESQCRVHLVLDPDERIEHHGPSLVQIERVRLHLGLRRWLIWVPSVDVESLCLCILAGLRLLDCRGLALGDGLPCGIRHNLFGGLGDGVAGMGVVYGGEAAREYCRSNGCRGVLVWLNWCCDMPRRSAYLSAS